MSRVARYGWIQSRPDGRDNVYSAPPHVSLNLPPRTSLREHMPKPYDQGQLGSCTGQGTKRAIHFLHQKAGHPEHEPSSLFLYYNGRSYEGTVSSDCGAQIRDVIKGSVAIGACLESTWGYVPARFAKKPTADAYREAEIHKATSYEAIPDLLHIKSVLVEGFPVVFGFSIPEEFEGPEVARSGVLPWVEGYRPVGGHCVVATGYDEDRQALEVCNSWGEEWGDKGYFWLDYDYWRKGMAADAWVIRVETGD